MSVYLGIDLGTQSAKVLVYDADRRQLLQVVSESLDLTSRDDGSREQLAHWWIDALKKCIARVDPATRQAVRAIGVSGQQHGFVPVDRDGQVLAPVKLWCDTATVAECHKIMAAVGGSARCIEIAGNPILPGYTASKVRWLRDSDRQAYERLATILLPHDYVNFWLTGQRFMEHGDASGTGWLDVRRRTWSQEMLRAIDPDRDLNECLPPLLDPDALVPISRSLAGELGLPATAAVSVGGGDNMMAAIGTRNVCTGRLTLSLGTSGTLFGFSDRPIIDSEGEFAAFCSSTGGWLPLWCTMNCTVATEQIRNTLGLDLRATEALLESTAPGAGGVITLPFYNGERAPNLPRAKAALMGLDVNNMSPANLLRSAMEGATFGLRRGLDAFARRGLEFDSICVTGGGASNRYWRQMVADIFNLPVLVLKHQEGAALGAALQAAWAHQRANGGKESLVDVVDEHLQMDETMCCAPAPHVSSRYEQFYNDYMTHLSVVQPFYSDTEDAS
jgi:xylulokinase